MDAAAASSAESIAAGRLDRETLRRNFSDLHPPLTPHEARIESDRCYFCFDAPCQSACPTSIDIPLFIREIGAGNLNGAAETILEANILGGSCARVCPTETLCQEACVREAAEGKPVQIGLLQRFAVDAMMAEGAQPFVRAAATGKRVAVVGAGPAGLACAHELARLGHAVTILEAREKSGGLNEYGIAAYKVPDDFAAREVAFVLGIGGIAVKHGAALGRDFDLGALRRDYDAVFLGVGLAAVNKLGLPAERDIAQALDAVDYIARLRQSDDLGSLPVGRRIVVIGGGMTAVDIAVQSKRLGAESVTIVYRRGQPQMKASGYEQELAQTNGVGIVTHAAPAALESANGGLGAVLFQRTGVDNAGETFRLECDVLFTAIGQALRPEDFVAAERPELQDGRIRVDAERRTSLPGVWAGGDCVAGGQDLTVAAVEDGKQAARSIDAALRQ